MNNYKRIFNNTVSLYIRMVILTLISLYTVRVVLNVLGSSDYGLYNVVGGIVSLFGFVSGSLINSAQRYFSYYLADDDWKEIGKIFSINMVIYIFLIVVITILGETVGLWFLLNKMNIDMSRMSAAVWVYQLSIFTFAFGLIAAPFQAMLIADENLKVYSVISIIEGILKLGMVYFLSVLGGDKLIIYAWLLFLARIITNGIYMTYAVKHYRKLKFGFVKDLRSYTDIFSYTSWNFIGAIASVFKSQGINIIINIFFGTTVNAARGIASQVNSTLVQFSQNFMKAIEPQIIKSYAKSEKERFTSIILFSSKLSFFLIFIVGLPLMTDMKYVLTLWLKNVPDNTIVFTILIIIDTMVSCITDPILTAVQATGKIKSYQLIVGGISLLNLPISYVLLCVMSDPLVPFFVGIGVTVLMLVGRLLIANAQINLKIGEYIAKVLLPVALVFILSSALSWLLIAQAENFLFLVRNVIISLVITLPTIYLIGLNKTEKQLLFQIISRRGS